MAVEYALIRLRPQILFVSDSRNKSATSKNAAFCQRGVHGACHYIDACSYPVILKEKLMKPFCRTVGACIVVSGLGLGFVLDEERHKHIEQRQYEIQAELTKEPSYTTASITHIQLFPAFKNFGANLGPTQRSNWPHFDP